jgi:hypothetical protein
MKPVLSHLDTMRRDPFHLLNSSDRYAIGDDRWQCGRVGLPGQSGVSMDLFRLIPVGHLMK